MKTIDIRVNEELIKRHDPCLGGLDNFKKHYKDISIKQLINSKKINYDHKVWLLKKIVPKELLVPWSIDSAFAAYAYSAISNRAVDAINSANYASRAAFYAADYAAHSAFYASEAADYAANADFYAADYAYYAAGNAAANAAAHAISNNVANAAFWDTAKNDRLQSLLYFIETEEEH